MTGEPGPTWLIALKGRGTLSIRFTGVVQCDGYQAYQRFATGRGGKVTLAGCLAHVRRKWYEAREQAPKLCAWVLGQFQHLYRIEAELRQTRAGPEERQRSRETRSRPIMERLERVLRKLVRQRRFLPRSSLGLALSYALECWPAVSVYLRDGRVEIDNNLVENSIRPTALGKKNWLFIGEAQAGERSANPLHGSGKLPSSRARSLRLPAGGAGASAALEQPAPEGPHACCLGRSADGYRRSTHRSISVTALLL